LLLCQLLLFALRVLLVMYVLTGNINCESSHTSRSSLTLAATTPALESGPSSTAGTSCLHVLSGPLSRS
jgi:hypothetical protein